MVEGVVKLVGEKPGRTLAVMCGIHGNEVCGMQAFERILPKLMIEAGTVYFIHANPKAIEQNVRFIDANMNRIFLPDEDLSDGQKASYEYQRSREIMPLLVECDALLDVHSSKNVGSKSFVICDKSHFDIAKYLPFSLRTHGWPIFEPGATDEYMDKLGGIGLAVECGYHLDSLAVDRAEQSIYAFLKAMGAISGEAPVYTQEVVRITGLYKTETNFGLAKVFTDFEPIVSGQIIGMDGGREVRAETGNCIIFAHDCDGPNQEAFLTGQSE